MIIDDGKLTLHKEGGEITTFQIHDIDAGGSPQYYGMLNNEGFWIIMRIDSTSVTYAKGDPNLSSYATNWANRASISYGILFS